MSLRTCFSLVSSMPPLVSGPAAPFPAYLVLCLVSLRTCFNLGEHTYLHDLCVARGAFSTRERPLQHRRNMLRQKLCFCTSKASKLRTCSVAMTQVPPRRMCVCVCVWIVARRMLAQACKKWQPGVHTEKSEDYINIYYEYEYYSYEYKEEVAWLRAKIPIL